MNYRHKTMPKSFLFALLLAAILAVGCQPQAAATVEVTAMPLPAPTATPAPEITAEAVSFDTEDGVKIAASLFEGGDVAVLLAHQGSFRADQTSWHPFARTIAAEGFTALTVDFRSYGLSEGERHRSLHVNDLNAAIQFLRDRGFERIVCMGASMGGTACIESALNSNTDLAGLAIVASTMGAVDPADFSRLTLPKIFVCAEDEAGLSRSMTEMYDLSPEPKEILFLPGTAHGTDMFDTESGPALRDALVGFLDGLR